CWTTARSSGGEWRTGAATASGWTARGGPWSAGPAGCPGWSGSALPRTSQGAFTHDHFSPSSHQQHGYYAAINIEPADSVWRDPYSGDVLGTRPDGGPLAAAADIITGPAGADSHREFNLFFADFALVYDAFGDPVNPPTQEEKPLPIAIGHEKRRQPEVISDADPGTMLVNYRNEPIPLRLADRVGRNRFRLKRGAEGDPAHIFNSNVHGDPFTPLLEAYQRDRVKIRTMVGAHEEIHSIVVHGVKWLQEDDDPDSGYVSAQPMGISQHFEFVFDVPPIKPRFDVADLLYASASDTDLWNGLFGLLRSYRKQQGHLRPLPNNRNFDDDLEVPLCPDEAKRRSYDVHAVLARDLLPERKLVYNERFDLYDPDAILFVKREHLGDLKRGRRKPEPLILRARAGECVKVTLHNDLRERLPQTPHWSYNPPITENFNVNQVKPSNHVGLHPQLVRVDVNEGNGANVGLNRIQTVAPGDKRTYHWYAGEVTLKKKRGTSGQAVPEWRPVELGMVNLRDFGDVVNHPMHGGIGALIVEPPDARWSERPDTDAQAVVRYSRPGEKNRRSFREYVVLIQNDVPLHSKDPRFQCEDRDLNCGTAIRNIQGADDAEDSGHKAYNYRTEPLWARFGLPPERAEELNDLDISAAFDSDVFGDPETPIFTAVAGQEVRFRVGMPAGHARNHSFHVHNTEFPNTPWLQNSTRLGQRPDAFYMSTVGSFSSERRFNLLPLNGAGGKARVPGDYLYRDAMTFGLTDGLWGIWRVSPR
ncbi:MAG: copper oxidase, partial [Myxococcales bacterium]